MQREGLPSPIFIQDEYDFRRLPVAVIVMARGGLVALELQKRNKLLRTRSRLEGHAKHRALDGTYVAVSPAHLQRYVDEQVYRFNARKGNDGTRFFQAMTATPGKRLTWKELVGTDGDHQRVKE
jgi:hypothetical protein